MAKLASTLKPGELVRVICPSSSLDKSDKDKIEQIKNGFSRLNLQVDFSKHCLKMNATIPERLDDIHGAFAEPEVKAIFAGAGGFSSNQLVDQIDYKLIKSRPKIFCGYSDITVLLNAIYARTGLITYHGPNAGGAGSKSGFEYTQKYLKNVLFSRKIYQVEPSESWFDKDYTQVEPTETKHKNSGFWALNPKGIVEGRLIGGNISCFSLLKATKSMPKLAGSILLIEDDYESQAHHFDALLEALTQLPDFKKVQGIIFGRFQPRSQINERTLKKIITTKPELNDLPILANVDFGHTKPQVTLPIGGIAQLRVLKGSTSIKVIEH